MLREKIDQTLDFIRSKTSLQPEIALVLGSGLGDLANKLEDTCTIPYNTIPHFMTSTAPRHKGQLVIGTIQGKVIMCMQGRLHYYEGYSMQEVTYPIRVMSAFGIKTLILTNASGGLNPTDTPGDLMILTDHINYMGANPLFGPNEDSFGPRFPDMCYTYKKHLVKIAQNSSKKLGIPLKEGIYVAYAGPSFETPAEIKLFQSFGGRAVGMSTVPEAIVANHSGMDVMAISCITNLAAGILDVPLSAEEVFEVAGMACEKFISLLVDVVENI